MKIALIATFCAIAATAATAQLASPIRPADDPPVRAVAAQPRTGHALLKADRRRVMADKERLKAARAARNDDAIRAEQVTLRADMDAWHADRVRRDEQSTAEGATH